MPVNTDKISWLLHEKGSLKVRFVGIEWVEEQTVVVQEGNFKLQSKILVFKI